MDNQVYIQAIITLLMLGILFVLIFVLFRGLVISSYRQALFAMRDEFFDEALDGKISFDSPAYNFIRDSLNAQIRYSHLFSVWSLIIGAALYVPHKSLFDTRLEAKWHQATQDLDPDTLNLVKKYYDRSSKIFLKYVFFTSPELIPIFLLLIIPIALLGLAAKTRSTLIQANKSAIFAREEMA